ncbi:reverse transcriptase-like protein [Rossellomorea vietnamensis]|uniref:Reverse transcriptase-like protein n=1 Tax=Rossellomorea vietnamensis TaxID=218284 RepID=A0A5D4KI68_9BACI|nr:reverse transcriptase-like protein [Rossellomorea vietnamensis]TYR76530.1 reverse transcriptase-like protein [Rossellomorea vietnamensis]
MIEVYIDGASAGDPGQSGAGIFIKNNGDNHSYSIPLGIKENHEAEFLACIKALQICKEKNYGVLSFRSDSQAVVNAVEKEFAKNKKYRPLLEQILLLSREFDLFFIKWIPSKENKRADELARKAIHLNIEAAEE